MSFKIKPCTVKHARDGPVARQMVDRVAPERKTRPDLGQDQIQLPVTRDLTFGNKIQLPVSTPTPAAVQDDDWHSDCGGRVPARGVDDNFRLGRHCSC